MKEELPGIESQSMTEMPREIKTCPFCAEDIDACAKHCIFCGEQLAVEKVANDNSNENEHGKAVTQSVDSQAVAESKTELDSSTRTEPTDLAMEVSSTVCSLEPAVREEEEEEEEKQERNDAYESESCSELPCQENNLQPATEIEDSTKQESAKDASQIQTPQETEFSLREAAGATQVLTVTAETQRCPHCAEAIKIEALVCRYCHHNIHQPDNSLAFVEQNRRDDKSQQISTELERRQKVKSTLACENFLWATSALDQSQLTIYELEINRLEKSTAIAYLLLVTVGLVGIHKFYLEDKWGYVYFFCLFPGFLLVVPLLVPIIGVLFDFAVLPWQVSKSNDRIRKKILLEIAGTM